MRYVVLPVYDTNRKHGEPLYSVYRVATFTGALTLVSEGHTQAQYAHRAAAREAEDNE